MPHPTVTLNERPEGVSLTDYMRSLRHEDLERSWRQLVIEEIAFDVSYTDLTEALEVVHRRLIDKEPEDDEYSAMRGRRARPGELRDAMYEVLTSERQTLRELGRQLHRETGCISATARYMAKSDPSIRVERMPDRSGRKRTFVWREQRRTP